MSIRWRVAENDYDKHDAYVLRSEGYRRYYRNIPHGIYMDKLDVALLPDGSPRSHTILVTKDNAAIGTGRISLIHSPRFPMMQSEIEFLFDMPNALLPTLENETNFNLNTLTIGEMSRFTVIDSQYSDDVMRAIFEGFVALGQHFGIDVFMAVTSPLVTKRVSHVGMYLQAIRNARLRRDNPETMWYCVKHFDYFFPRLTKLLPEVGEANFSEKRTLSDGEMLDILNVVYPKDWVGLYWVSQQMIIDNVLQPVYKKAVARA